ncbi:MAG: hypothetical protein ACXQTG_03175 [Methanoculleaceae archaeon]
MIGKDIFMERIVDRETGRTIIVPVDHGVTSGPVAERGANALLGHPAHARDTGLILHLPSGTALSPDPDDKVIVNSVLRDRCSPTPEGSRWIVWCVGCRRSPWCNPVGGVIGGAMTGGAAGISIGRNAIQHERPDR